jgi:hypothetical protein
MAWHSTGSLSAAASLCQLNPERMVGCRNPFINGGTGMDRQGEHTCVGLWMVGWVSRFTKGGIGAEVPPVVPSLPVSSCLQAASVGAYCVLPPRMVVAATEGDDGDVGTWGRGGTGRAEARIGRQTRGKPVGTVRWRRTARRTRGKPVREEMRWGGRRRGMRRWGGRRRTVGCGDGEDDGGRGRRRWSACRRPAAGRVGPGEDSGWRRFF